MDETYFNFLLNNFAVEEGRPSTTDALSSLLYAYLGESEYSLRVSAVKGYFYPKGAPSDERVPATLGLLGASIVRRNGRFELCNEMVSIDSSHMYIGDFASLSKRLESIRLRMPGFPLRFVEGVDISVNTELTRQAAPLFKIMRDGYENFRYRVTDNVVSANHEDMAYVDFGEGEFAVVGFDVRAEIDKEEKVDER